MTLVLDRPVPVADEALPEQIVIVVTADDIALGVRSDAMACPVARALSRHGHPDVHVGWYGVCLHPEGTPHCRDYCLDQQGREFVRAFDCKRSVEPCRLVLERSDNFGRRVADQLSSGGPCRVRVPSVAQVSGKTT